MSRKPYAIYILLLALCFALLPMPKKTKASSLTKPTNNLGLVLYWPMDEGRGAQTEDKSGNGNIGTVAGSSWIDGKRSKGLSFGSGITDYVQKSSFSSFPTTEMTTAFWVKNSDSSDGVVSYATSGQNNEWLLFGSSSLGVYIGGTVYATGIKIGDGVWRHIVVTWKSSNGSLIVYKDGISVFSTTGNRTGYSLTQGGCLMLAQEQDSVCGTLDPVQSMQGQMDDFRIYNRVISASDVTALYQSGLARQTIVSNQGLVGHWKFDEGRGYKAGDSSGSGNTGTITGASWVDGKRGKALNLNGTTEFIGGFGDKYDMKTNNQTVSIWFKGDTLLQRGYLVSKSKYGAAAGRWGIQLSTDGVVSVFMNCGGSDISTTGTNTKVVSDNNWHNITGVFNRDANFVTYIDGIIDGSADISSCNGVDMDNPYYFLIGTYGDETGTGGIKTILSLKGKIDDVRIYNRALSASEIQILYRQGDAKINSSQNNKLTNGLVGLWSFDGADIFGATAYDRSGQSNDGTIAGAVPNIGKVGQGLFCKESNQIDLPNIASVNSVGTYSLWIKPNSNNASQGWIDSNFDIFQWNGSLLYFRAGAQSAVSISSWRPEDWHHVAMVWNGTNYFGYIDGSQVTTGAQSGTRSGNIYLCRVDGGYFATGSIDEVRIYNRALSASEVKQLYNMGK